MKSSKSPKSPSNSQELIKKLESEDIIKPWKLPNHTFEEPTPKEIKGNITIIYGKFFKDDSYDKLVVIKGKGDIYSYIQLNGGKEFSSPTQYADHMSKSPSSRKSGLEALFIKRDDVYVSFKDMKDGWDSKTSSKRERKEETKEQTTNESYRFFKRPKKSETTSSRDTDDEESTQELSEDLSKSKNPGSSQSADDIPTERSKTTNTPTTTATTATTTATTSTTTATTATTTAATATLSEKPLDKSNENHCVTLTGKHTILTPTPSMEQSRQHQTDSTQTDSTQTRNQVQTPSTLSPNLVTPTPRPTIATSLSTSISTSPNLNMNFKPTLNSTPATSVGTTSVSAPRPLMAPQPTLPDYVVQQLRSLPQETLGMVQSWNLETKYAVKIFLDRLIHTQIVGLTQRSQLLEHQVRTLEAEKISIKRDHQQLRLNLESLLNNRL